MIIDTGCPYGYLGVNYLMKEMITGLIWHSLEILNINTIMFVHLIERKKRKGKIERTTNKHQAGRIYIGNMAT